MQLTLRSRYDLTALARRFRQSVVGAQASALVLSMFKTSADVWRLWRSYYALARFRYVANSLLEILLRFALRFHTFQIAVGAHWDRGLGVTGV